MGEREQMFELVEAIKNNDPEKFYQKYEKRFLDCDWTTDNRSLLMYSAGEGQYEITEFLLKEGASVNHFDLFLQTPIFFAVHDPKIVKLLIQYGALVNVEDEDKNTPEDFAEWSHCDESVKIIREQMALEKQ